MPLTDKEYLQINQGLFSLTHSYETRMQKESSRWGSLSLADCSVLMVLAQLEPLTGAKLSETMDINPGTISVYVRRLENSGLLVRRQDEEDRRNWWLSLTNEGRKTAQEVIRNAVTYTQDFLAKISEEEQKELHTLLVKASHSLGFEWQ